MKGDIFSKNANEEGLKLNPGSIIKLIASDIYPDYIGDYLIRADNKFIKYDYILIKRGCAFSDLNGFKWEIIKET